MNEKEIHNRSVLVYANIWRRLAAEIIDELLSIGLVYAIIYILAEYTTWHEIVWGFSNITIHIRNLVCAVIIGLILPALMESSVWQATPGKLLLGIKVWNLKIERISFAGAILRYIIKILDRMTLVGLVLVFFTKQKQTLHDVVAKTIVLKDSPKKLLKKNSLNQ